MALVNFSDYFVEDTLEDDLSFQQTSKLWIWHSFVCAIAILVNLALWVLTIFDKRLQMPMFIAVLSWATGNLLSAMFPTPILIDNTRWGSFNHSVATCKIYLLLLYVHQPIEAGHVVLISAIPLVQESLTRLTGSMASTKKTLVIACIVIWISSLLIYARLLFTAVLYSTDASPSTGLSYCVNSSASTWSDIIDSIGFGVLPFLIATVFTICSCSMKNVSAPFKLAHPWHDLAVIIVILLAYILLLMPMQAYIFISIIDHTITVLDAHVVVQSLWMLNLCVPATLLLLLPTPYRHALVQVIRKRIMGNADHTEMSEITESTRT